MYNNLRNAISIKANFISHFLLLITSPPKDDKFVINCVKGGQKLERKIHRMKGHYRAIQGNSREINPFSPNSDQHQSSPCNINAYSTSEVMRIKDMITQGEFS